MSTIDDLQRLHEAATKGEWFADPNDIHVYAKHGPKSPMWLATCPTNMVASIGVRESDDARLIAALHNAWPAIHRVLVAARALMQCPKCIGPCDDPTVHAELEEALRALDDKEQRT